MRTKRLSLCLILVLAVVAAVSSCGGGGGGGGENDPLTDNGNKPEWTISTIDSTGYVGKYSSIAVDTNNNIHISYYKGADNSGATSQQYDLKYATNASGAWVVTTVDSTGNVGEYSSIATDSKNKVHISYRDAINGLKYATNASGLWEKTVVDDKIVQFTSIAIDGNDKVHIAYYEANTVCLKYATNDTESWVLTVVDNPVPAVVGFYNDITIDKNNNNKVHISYFDSTNSALKYATNESDIWVNSTIDNSGYIGRDSSIAIDSNSKVHISYWDKRKYLRYATGVSGSWVTTTIDGTNANGYSSIAVDKNDNVHISYQGNIFHLTYATNASESWVITDIDTYNEPTETSIALDSNDRVHISYYSYANGDLMYATNQ